MLAALGQGNGLLHRGAGAEQLTDFVDGGTQCRCAVEGLEAECRSIAALDAAVILLKAVVQILTGTVDDFPATRLPNGCSVGGYLSVVTQVGFTPAVCSA